MPDALDMPKGSELIVLSRDQLAEFARTVIVAYREDEAARPQAVASTVVTGALVVDLLAFEARVKGAVVRMKPREFKLRAALAHNRGHSITRERLLELVWDDPAKLDGERTVDVHIQRIRRRLGDDAKDLIETVHTVGYKLRKVPVPAGTE